MRRILFCILFSLLILSCKKENNTIKKNPQPKNYPNIENFSFFKKGMSYDNVINKLRENKISFYDIHPSDTSKIIHLPLENLPISDILKAKYNLKVIEGKHLKILNTEIPTFQLGFVNNNLLYFKYFSFIARNKSKNGVETEKRTFTDNENSSELKPISASINNDLELLKILSDGLTEKYGSPTEKLGNLNAFNPTSNPFYEYGKSGSLEHSISFLEHSEWLNKNGTRINLRSFCSKDSIMNKTEMRSYTDIEVLFDFKLYSEIRKLIIKTKALEKLKEKRAKELIKTNEKVERAKQLNDL